MCSLALKTAIAEMEAQRIRSSADNSLKDVCPSKSEGVLALRTFKDSSILGYFMEKNYRKTFRLAIPLLPQIGKDIELYESLRRYLFAKLLT
jgi:hypothetical protein